MSKVTNAILVMGSANLEILPVHYPHCEARQLLAQVNLFFGQSPGFVLVDDEKLPEAWYGGTKNLEAVLAIGAFNHLDLPELVNWLRLRVNWPNHLTDEIQLVVREQDDERFRIFQIFPEIEEPPIDHRYWKLYATQRNALLDTLDRLVVSADLPLCPRIDPRLPVSSLMRDAFAIGYHCGTAHYEPQNMKEGELVECLRQAVASCPCSRVDREMGHRAGCQAVRWQEVIDRVTTPRELMDGA